MSLEIRDDHFMVCTDCQMIIVNDDASGLDYSLDEDVANEREEQIRKAISDIQSDGSYLIAGDDDQNDEFSSRACDCCGTRLAGERYHCRLLRNVL
ncbi:MAG TPA: hypothetical protein DEO68_10950 [Halomonas campaniensis]|uniref:Uncharacterized protein n=2 Tax=Oceanospirillales TaxID=135619 RepID=A0A3D0KGI2_9GAMM|nr:hypothetical protein [Halomonas campaniensis]